MGMSTAGSREINVTPLIDVLLVLLVIFLIIMPIMLRTEQVAIPRADRGEVDPEASLSVKLDADLSVSFEDGPRFPNRELPSRLRAELPKVHAVFVDSVGGVPWGMVVST